MDRALVIAMRHEYAAAHNGRMPKMTFAFWMWVANVILDAFHEFEDDACLEWQHDLVDKHLSAILAECPELANDEDSLAYQDE